MQNSISQPNELLGGYFTKLSQALDLVDQTELGMLFSTLLELRRHNRQLFIAGNGGSASTAQHFAIDLGVGGINRHSIIRAISLSDNQSAITALANDIDFRYVFSSLLTVFGNQNDLLLVISASGNSENLIEAVNKAKSLGIQTFGMLGFDGGVLRGICDQSILIETRKGEYGIVEDIHLSICHNLTEALRGTAE